MKFRIISLAALALTVAVSLCAQEQKMRIAIMDITPSAGVSADVASSVSELMRTEMFNTGLFRVVEREQMDKIMKEQELQSSGCTDTECAVQVGKLLAVDRMLVGKISKLGAKYIINARIIHVERGEMEFAEKGTVDSVDDLDRAVTQFAQAIAARIRSSKTGAPTFVQPKVTVKPTDTRTPINVGSSGGSDGLLMPAIGCMGAGAAVGAYGLVMFFMGGGAYQAYNNADTNTSAIKFEGLWGNVDGAKTLMNFSIYGSAGLIGIGATMLVIDIIGGGLGKQASSKYFLPATLLGVAAGSGTLFVGSYAQYGRLNAKYTNADIAGLPAADWDVLAQSAQKSALTSTVLMYTTIGTGVLGVTLLFTEMLFNFPSGVTAFNNTDSPVQYALSVTPDYCGFNVGLRF
ncbi:MAG: hypothetical protein HZC28_05670 [Spirochaetes bacterium]|nr:hypothetical protein [Spirochaetota bacterium]